MAEEVFERVKKMVRACSNCFVAGTVAVTACGWVPIEEVQVGDWVWARDEVTGEVRLCEVEETYRNESPVILEVTAGGETLATTPGHPFWVLHVGWKDAGELEVGDHLVTLRGESVVVEDIRRRPVPEAVYNFSVAGLHTYFVGLGEIWVHNSDICPPDGANRGIDYQLKRPDGITDDEWKGKLDAMNAQADAGKAKVVYDTVRDGKAQKEARQQGMIEDGHDADHALDLQFGGEDVIGNIRSTPSRVNRSVGGQGHRRKLYPEGTPIRRFIEDE